MNKEYFTTVAQRYERDSLVQKSAADKLIDLVAIGQADDVLDLGCGPGNVTSKLRPLTNGRVVGVDSAEGMIRAAREGRSGRDITFSVGRAGHLDVRNAFDAIFCNSAFQWFDDPDRVLTNCHQVLRKGGRMGIQAPATKRYCPGFLKAIHAVALDNRTGRVFSSFTPPWLFFDTPEEYAALFRKAGFTVPYANIEEHTSRYTPQEVMAIFESGAAAGYLNQEYYKDRIDDEYVGAFREIALSSFRGQAGEDGKVPLTFSRVYLVAVKEES